MTTITTILNIILWVAVDGQAPDHSETFQLPAGTDLSKAIIAELATHGIQAQAHGIPALATYEDQQEGFELIDISDEVTCDTFDVSISYEAWQA